MKKDYVKSHPKHYEARQENCRFVVADCSIIYIGASQLAYCKYVCVH